MASKLAADDYSFGPYDEIVVEDPKRRTIHKAPFQDRVLHQAIHREIEPFFDRRMIHDTYACRKGKGTSQAAKRLRGWVKKYPFALKMDVRRYFASIDHGRLLEKLEPILGRDPRLMGLVEKLIFSFSPGIPIGNLTSQLFANWYLNDLDHMIKRKLKVKAYLRYMDDLVLLSDSKKELWSFADEISSFAEDSEKLFFPERKIGLYPTEKGVPFLGYRIFSRKAPRLQVSNLNRFRGKEKQSRQQVIGWWGHACFAAHPKLCQDLGIDHVLESLTRHRLG